MAADIKHRCSDCGEVFKLKQGLAKHSDKKVCFQKLFLNSTQDDQKTNNEIVEELTTLRLKFLACQRLGVFSKKLYPLMFCNEFTDSLEPLVDLLPSKLESIEIVTELLKVESCVVLPQKMQLIIGEKLFDISSVTLQNVTEIGNLPFDVKFEGAFVILKLRNVETTDSCNNNSSIVASTSHDLRKRKSDIISKGTFGKVIKTSNYNFHVEGLSVMIANNNDPLGSTALIGPLGHANGSSNDPPGPTGPGENPEGNPDGNPDGNPHGNPDAGDGGGPPGPDGNPDGNPGGGGGPPGPGGNPGGGGGPPGPGGNPGGGGGPPGPGGNPGGGGGPPGPGGNPGGGGGAPPPPPPGGNPAVPPLGGGRRRPIPRPHRDPAELERQQLIIRNRRTTLGTGQGARAIYDGFGVLGPYRTVAHARDDLFVANSSIQQYLSLVLAPKILTDNEIKYFTGCTRRNFDGRVDNLSPDMTRTYKLLKDAKMLAFMDKLKHNPSFWYQGMLRNVSEACMSDNFWDHVVHLYREDRTLPCINSNVRNTDLNPEQILRNNVCTHPYYRQILWAVHEGVRDLVILCLDHTYLQCGKLQCHQAQQRTYYGPKNHNLLKIGVLCTERGQIVHYTPLQSAKVPSSGDGNHLMWELWNGQQHNIRPVMDRLLQPNAPDLSVCTFFDNGYEHNRGANRGTNLTRRDYYSPNDPSYNPNCRGFVPVTAGAQLLDNNLRPIANPHGPGNNRQLTSLEANMKRLCTIFRHVSERRFASLKDYDILSSKVINTDFLNEIGDRLPEDPHRIKLEMIFHCVASLVMENWAAFDVTWVQPQNMTWAQMGDNFRERLNKRCSFDPTEGVTYDLNFDGRLALRHWHTYRWDDHANLHFPQFVLADFTIVSHGSYAIKMCDAYLTNLNFHQVKDMINATAANPDVEWDDWNALNSGIPDDTYVHTYEQVNQPNGWDVNNLGPWFRRTVLCVNLPGRHSSNSHRVLIEYLPTHDENGEPIPLANGFVNPFGFTQPGLERIVGYGCRRFCKVGYRQAGICSHAAAVLIYLGIYAYDRTGFKSKHKLMNLADPISTELPASLAEKMYAH